MARSLSKRKKKPEKNVIVEEVIQEVTAESEVDDDS